MVSPFLVSTLRTFWDTSRLGSESMSAVNPDGRLTSMTAMLLSAFSDRLRFTNLQK